MSDKEKNKPIVRDQAIDRRHLLLGTSTLVAVAALTSEALAQAQSVAMRYENWKAVFEEQRVNGTMRIWAEPFTKLRVPKFYNLRSDPYERADVTYQGLSAEPAAIELQHRSDRREDAEEL
jgi:hypothetical protein